MGHYFSNEIVFKSHPDKVADQISDAILDAYLSKDPNSRCGIETVGGKGKIFITGEVTSRGNVNVPEIVRNVLKDVGYSTEYEIINNIGVQSPDIAQGVDVGGAGDQGMMFGYACRDTEQLIPTAMAILQALSRFYDGLRRVDRRFLPDGKAQITGYYDDNNKLEYIKDFVISYQNTEKEREETDKILMYFCEELCGEYGVVIKKFHINPTGKFLIGGFEGDAGLTGRKIVVDNYQSFANVGGGCVDRDTEILTTNGWKKICDYSKNDFVAQWDNGRMTFTKGEFIKLPKTKMYYAKTPQTIDMVLSDDHNFLYRTSKGNYNKIKFAKVVEAYNKKYGGFRGDMPIYFTYDFQDNYGIKLSDAEIRLQIAFCADGTILTNNSNWNGRIRVKKSYKKERLSRLLEDCAYNYKTTKDGDYDIYYFNPPINSKSLNNCFREVNKEQARIVAEEVVMWDGDRKNIFRTTIKEDADFIQFVFMATSGKNVSITVDDRIGENYDEKYLRKSVCYEVYKCNRQFSNAFRKNSKYDPKLELSEYTSDDKYMYCINVPTHNLVLRRNNKVFITGNCFSGKDPTKVDRSAAYKARQIAIDWLKKHKSTNWCEVQLSYAIGLAKPLAVYVRTDKGDFDCTADYADECTPSQIIKDLKLREQSEIKYYNTAQFGHFGLSSFPWEKVQR